MHKQKMNIEINILKFEHIKQKRKTIQKIIVQPYEIEDITLKKCNFQI